MSGASPDECVEQIDIGGPTMVRAAAKNHPTVAVVVDPARYPDVLDRGAPPAASRSSSGSGWRPRRSRTPRRTTCRRVLDGQRARADRRGHRVAGLGRRDAGSAPTCCATARTRTSGPRSTATASSPRRASRRPSSCTARQMSYNNYVDTDAARRAAYDFDRPVRRDHQARQPVRHRGRRRRRRGAPQGARVRPGVGVRRRHRGQPAGDASRWPSRSPRSSPRWSSRRRTTTARWRCWRARRTSGCCVRPPAAAAAPRPRPVSGGLLMQDADAVDAPATTRRRGRWSRGDAGRRRRRWPTWRSRGGPCRAVKSNAILLAADGATVGVGMGQVNRVDSARLAVARAGERAAGLGRGLGRVLPVRRRAAGAARRRRARGRPAGRVGARRRGGRRGRRAAGVTMYLTGTRHFFH